MLIVTNCLQSLLDLNFIKFEKKENFNSFYLITMLVNLLYKRKIYWNAQFGGYKQSLELLEIISTFFNFLKTNFLTE